MIERWTRRIVAMGRSHKWLRPLTLFVLLGLFGGAALAEWTARRSSRAWRAAGERRAAYAQQLSACRERRARSQARQKRNHFRSSHRPASRVVAAVLSVCMMFTLLPSAAFAAETETGLCEHHSVHTVECRYQEAMPGQPCAHEHTADCCTGELVCGLEEGAVADNGEPHTHTQDCCALDCPHERGMHDESCGYTEAVEAVPCGYVCTECVTKQPDKNTVQNNGIHRLTVTAFDELNEAVKNQTVKAGTPLGELVLPDTLRATIYTTAPDTEPVVIQGVTWTPDRPYEGAAGSYTFTASAAGYACADGADWPVIDIIVEEQPAPEPTSYEAAVALFAALPDPEAVAGMSDEEKDTLSAQIGGALDALFALPDEDYDRFLAEHTDYMELADALQKALTGGVKTLAESGTGPGGHIRTADALQTALGGSSNATVTGNTVMLQKDVELSSYIYVPSGTLTLDLNGHALSIAENSRLLTVVGSGTTFALKDSSLDKSGSVKSVEFRESVAASIDGGTIDSLVVKDPTSLSISAGIFGSINFQNTLRLKDVVPNGSVVLDKDGNEVANWKNNTDNYITNIQIRKSADIANETPQITKNLSQDTIYCGMNASKELSITATVGDGGPLTYQWYQSTSKSGTGTPISNATAASYTVPTTALGTSYYYVVVTNSKSGISVKSQTATVTVNTTGNGGPGGHIRTASELQAALGGPINAEITGNTVTLQKDVELSSYIYVPGGTLTLDMNGHELSIAENSRLLTVVGSGTTFALEDSSHDKSGSVESVEFRESVVASIDGGTINSLVVKDPTSLSISAGTFGSINFQNTSLRITDILAENTGVVKNNGQYPENWDQSEYLRDVSVVPLGTGDTMTWWLQNQINKSNGSTGNPAEITIPAKGDINSTINVPAGKYVKLTGETLTRSADFSSAPLFSVNGALTLENITLDGNKANAAEGGLVEVDGGKLTLTTGAVLQNSKGSAVRVCNGGSVIMNDGKISGNEASAGGGVYVFNYLGETGGTFTMNGGEISGNTAEAGSGVYITQSSTFYLHKGVIKGNAAPENVSSGGWDGIINVELRPGSNSNTRSIFDTPVPMAASFGVTIPSSPDSWGGGVYNMGTFTMDGGEISDNTAGRGGAIYHADGTCSITGGTISGNQNTFSGTGLYAREDFSIGGSAKITDGIYLVTGKKALVTSALSNSIQIEGMEGTPTDGTVVAAGSDHTISDADFEKFSIKDTTWTLEKNTGSQICLKAPASQQSSAKQITAFTIANQVGDTIIDQDNHTIAVTMPAGTAVTNLTPSITVSDNATISPTTGTAQDFTNPVTYTVTAQDNTTQNYIVTVTVQASEATVTITFDAGGGSVTPASAQTGTDGKLQSLPTPTRSNHRFDGWFTAATGGMAVTTATVFTQSSTIYAHWTYMDGSDGDFSGGSDNNNSTPPTIETPPAAKSDAPTTVEIEIKAQGDGQGGAEVTVPTSAVESAIQKAQEEAKRNGTLDNGIAVQVSVAANSPDIDSLTVNLPKVTQEQIIDNKVQTFALVLERPDITLSLNLASVQEINRQANADVQLTATRLTDTASLSGEARAVVGDRPVFRLTATYRGGQVTDFGAGSVFVEIPYTLQKGELASNVYAIYVDDNGKVTYLTNSIYDAKRGVVMFTTNHFSLYGIGYKAPATFSDIKDHWAEDDIQFVAARGLLNGTGNNQFSPDGAMTRGMFVTALGRLAGIDPAGCQSGTFTDVKADAYYAPYVEWANQNNIVNGTGDGQFSPDQSITREQMAAILVNYAKATGFTLPKVHEENTFADSADISTWAKDAVKSTQMAGVLVGKGNNHFDPQGTATRAEVAAMLRRFLELMIDQSTAQG